MINLCLSVLLLSTQKKYLVRVLLNLFQKVISTSTLRGGFQKYLVRVLNTLEILKQKINLIKIYI